MPSPLHSLLTWSPTAAVDSLSHHPGGEALISSSGIKGLITSASLFGALAGSLLCLALSSSRFLVGRKQELMLGSLLYASGSLLSVLASRERFDPPALRPPLA